MGGQANVWTEYRQDWQHMEYMVSPRISAMSETLWSDENNKDFDRFAKKPSCLRRLPESV
ncbi:MAG: family 20 glycosylhydrolase [candidate division Zixibacteria bacterium]|nr:family 20 glycosylhydrolase [candidate division Zixibacteria bacterium]